MTKGEKTNRDFVSAFFAESRNAKKAYKRIKPKATDKTCEVEGSKFLRKPEVQALIAIREAELQEEFHIDQKRVLQEISRLSFFDIRKLFKEDGVLKQPHELDDDTAAAISAIDVEDLYENRERVGYVRKFKTHSKTESLEKLMKYLGMYEKDNNQKPDTVKELLKWISEQGIRLEVRK